MNDLNKLTANYLASQSKKNAFIQKQARLFVDLIHQHNSDAALCILHSLPSIIDHLPYKAGFNPIYWSCADPNGAFLLDILIQTQPQLIQYTDNNIQTNPLYWALCNHYPYHTYILLKNGLRPNNNIILEAIRLGSWINLILYFYILRIPPYLHLSYLQMFDVFPTSLLHTTPESKSQPYHAFNTDDSVYTLVQSSIEQFVQPANRDKNLHHTHLMSYLDFLALQYPQPNIHQPLPQPTDYEEQLLFNLFQPTFFFESLFVDKDSPPNKNKNFPASAL